MNHANGCWRFNSEVMKPGRNHFAWVLLLVGAGAGVGCGPQRQQTELPTGPVGNVALSLELTPIVQDTRSGPQGVVGVVTLFQVDPVQAVSAQGPVSVAMYEGDLSTMQIRRTEPYHRWTFTPAQLLPFVGRYDLHMLGYRVPLLWGDRRPRTDAITLVASYENPSGPTVNSAPSVFLLRQR